MRRPLIALALGLTLGVLGAPAASAAATTVTTGAPICGFCWPPNAGDPDQSRD